MKDKRGFKIVIEGFKFFITSLLKKLQYLGMIRRACEMRKNHAFRQKKGAESGVISNAKG